MASRNGVSFKLVGLTSAALNGTIVTMVEDGSRAPSSGRVKVRLPSSKVVAVKPENLLPQNPDASAARPRGGRSKSSMSAVEKRHERANRQEDNNALVAVSKGDLRRLRILLFEKHANPDAREDAASPSGSGFAPGATVLMMSMALWISMKRDTAKKEAKEMAEMLLDAGASVNLKSSMKLYAGAMQISPLMYTAQMENVLGVQLLLRYGANASQRSSSGAPVFFFAAQAGNLEILKLLHEHGADINARTTRIGCTPLLIATEKGHLDCVRFLLEIGSVGINIKTTDVAANRPARVALTFNRSNPLLKWQPEILRLLLQYGSDPFISFAMKHRHGIVKEGDLAQAITGYSVDPRIIHLLTDFGGFSLCTSHQHRSIADETKHTIHQVSRPDDGVISTKLGISIENLGALRAFRQVGFDTWCDGGCAMYIMRLKHNVDGTKVLNEELVDHTVQLRLRPWHLTRVLTNLGVGTSVVLHSLNAVKMNGKFGVVVGVVGATKEGRYDLRIGGSIKNVKPCNIRSAHSDPFLQRATAAGHEVDALLSVAVSGCSGRHLAANGVYTRDFTEITKGGFPVFAYREAGGSRVWYLYCQNMGEWLISDAVDEMRNGGCQQEQLFILRSVFSETSSPSPLGHRWKSMNLLWGTPSSVSCMPAEEHPGSSALGSQVPVDTAIKVDTPVWIAGSPPAPWVYREAVVEAFCEGSNEHKLVFTDHERTTVWLPLHHFRIYDLDVMPLRRAAIYRPRT